MPAPRQRFRLPPAIPATLRYLTRASLHLLAGGLVALLIVFIVYLDNRPDLSVWHKVDLEQEFTRQAQLEDFEHYLALEDRLFQELDEKVYGKITDDEKSNINRYNRGSLSDPDRWPRNWNRSFQLPHEHPRVAVLLLHGMSDSPYSLRGLGERLNDRGAWVLGLRLPGHGTAPAGLITMDWQDMAAAIRLAIDHLHQQASELPLFIVGYSTGAALAVHYAVQSLQDNELPKVRGLVLISPAMGVSPVAALAVWQARIGHLLGLEKLAWNSILPEYDPFKYGSFAINAGDQVYRLTLAVKDELKKLLLSGRASEIPSILAFQSVVDATVSVPATANNLLLRLPRGQHELVLFDINHAARMENLLSASPQEEIQSLIDNGKRNFTLTVISNRDLNSTEVASIRYAPGSQQASIRHLDMRWPEAIYSLSHVALPFSAKDPLYGMAPRKESPNIHLGSIDLKGEKGALRIPASDIIRQRWNPFYPWLEQRILTFMGL